MGIIDGFLGNASDVDPVALQAEIAPILLESETVEKVYKVIRDLWVFTNKRLVLVDKQGLTGSKVEYLSIPYKFITRFSVETAGKFDMDAELKIWVSGSAMPIEKPFKKGTNVLDIQRMLAAHVLG